MWVCVQFNRINVVLNALMRENIAKPSLVFA